MFVLQLTSQAQNKKHFIITGKIVPEGGETVSGVIEVTKNGKETSRIDIPKNGRFRFELEFFNEFSLKFQYPGHFDKIILVSTEIPQEVWERDSDFPPFPMVVQLLKEFEGIDKSFSLKPSGRIFYGKDIDNFEKESYISDIQFVEQIENAKSIANQVQKESESISKENAQDLASKQKSFEQTIKEADTHYQRGEYQMALMKYLEARKLFPDKAYPNDRVAELQDLVKALEITEKQKADLEQKYKAAITRGNGFFDQKSYREARPVYEEALQYKLGDVYANGRINEIDQLLALLDKQKQYNQNIQSGATLSQQKDYMSALAQYKKALELKPDSQLARDKIAEMELAIVGIETDKKYLQAIQLADQALASNDFQQAKKQYQEALKIKGNEAYPSGKLAEIEKTEANEINFNALTAKAEKAYADTNIDESLKLFEQALELKPKNALVQNRINELQNLKKQQVSKKEYDDLILQADQSFSDNQLDASLATYNRALSLNKSEAYPKDQIKKIETYQSLIKKADKSFNSQDYSSSLDLYNQALTQIPNGTVASGKIAEINGILGDKKKLEEQAKAELNAYNDLVKVADELFTALKYTESITKYQEAANLRTSESYPKKRIKEIATILEGLEKDKAQKEKEYLAVISQADKLFERKDYPNALAEYRKALEMKPEDVYPKDQIRNIDQLLAENLLKDQENQRFQNEKIGQEYSKAMADADKAFIGNEFENARSGYQSALTIKPNDAAAKEKLGKTEAKIDEMLTQKEAEAKTLADFKSIIADAGNDFKNTDYPNSREKYQKALGLKPAETFPKEQIAKIDEILASLQKATEKDNQYTQLIIAAEGSFGQNKLKEARDTYQKAYNLKPFEPVPPMRIAQIDAMLAKLAEDAQLAVQDEVARLAKQKADRDQYNRAIAAGDKSFTEKQYMIARLHYTTALTALPDEKYPKDQIAKIDDLLSLAEKDKALAQQKAKQDSLQKEKDKVFELAMASAKDQNYTSVLKKGDRAFDASSWQDARVAYTEALSVKPNEAYPTNRLNEVNQKIADANMTETSNAAEEKAYHEALAEAEKALKVDQLTTAKMQFEVARSLKPDEKLPVQRIKEIDILMDQRNKDRLAQSQRELDEKYRQALSVADNSFKEKTYTIAKLQYQQALLIKPEESYPKTQIVLIDKLLSEAKPVETYAFELPKTETIQTVPKPIYNPAETAQATEARAQSYTTTTNYDEAVKKADDSFGIKDYSVARFFYLKASEIKPSEEYPKKQLELIRKLIDSQLSNSDISGYEQAIAQADAAFDKKTYGIAKFYYYKALEIKSWEKYPKDRINEILALTNSLLSEKEEKEYRDIIAIADEAYFNKDIAIARFYYNRALSIKKDENYPSIKLKDIQKLIEQDRNDQEKMDYQNIIDQADQAMQSENFSIARFNYNKALTLKPDEKHPKDQLKKIKEALDKKKN